MPESIRSKYGSKTLDKVICHFMRTILHIQKMGVENLPLENDLEEPLRSFLDIAIDLIIDGQPPEIAKLILDSEYDIILNNRQVDVETVLCLQFIKELSWHIHYDKDCYAYLLSTDNLWENDAFEYASRTFYPNLPEEIKERYHMSELITGRK